MQFLRLCEDVQPRGFWYESKVFKMLVLQLLGRSVRPVLKMLGWYQRHWASDKGNGEVLKVLGQRYRHLKGVKIFRLVLKMLDWC